MLRQLVTDKPPALPKPIADFVNDVCEKQRRYGNFVIPPPMLIPLSSGNGRSHIAGVIARQYYEKKVIEFSSRDICIDFKLEQTVQRVRELDAHTQTYAEYKNAFAGVLILDADALIQCLRDMPGSEFFERIAKIKQTAALIIFVPAECTQSNLDYISEKLGVGVKVFSPIVYSDEEVVRFFYDFLPSGIKPSGTDDDFQKNKERICAYISNNIRTKTIKCIKEAAQAVFYCDEAKTAIFGKDKKTSDTVEIGGIIQ